MLSVALPLVVEDKSGPGRGRAPASLYKCSKSVPYLRSVAISMVLSRKMPFAMGQRLLNEFVKELSLGPPLFTLPFILLGVARLNPRFSSCGHFSVAVFFQRPCQFPEHIQL